MATEVVWTNIWMWAAPVVTTAIGHTSWSCGSPDRDLRGALTVTEAGPEAPSIFRAVICPWWCGTGARVVFEPLPADTAGAHTVRIVVVGTADRPTVTTGGLVHLT
ncbi:hypothetical protein [Streptomyces sp. NPDC046374]|uniref:hypothetical protein n=1 Tax=unclassified Streptomyces TaxID=2593676 RepID=UPI0033FDD8DE